MEIIAPTKTCTNCNESKPATSKFFTQRQGTITTYCKVCRAAYSKAYYAANRQKTLDRYKTNHFANPQHNRDLYNARYAANPQKKKDRNKARVAADPEKHRAAVKASHIKYPETSTRKRHKRRAHKNNALTESYTIKQIISIYGNDCHICMEQIDLTAPRSTRYLGWELGLHLDHVIPLSKGGSDLIENVRPAHAQCNLVKGALIPR